MLSFALAALRAPAGCPALRACANFTWMHAPSSQPSMIDLTTMRRIKTSPNPQGALHLLGWGIGFPTTDPGPLDPRPQPKLLKAAPAQGTTSC